MAEAYVERMIEEGKALRNKIYALDGFLQGVAGQQLPAEKRSLMEKQLKAMRKYSDILTSRISLEK